eukprot:SAG22_NODE_844_length_6872_cov_10.004577_7_plen_103_part_00
MNDAAGRMVGASDNAVMEKLGRRWNMVLFRARAAGLDSMLVMAIFPIFVLFADDMYTTYAQRGDGIGFFGSSGHPDHVCGLWDWMRSNTVKGIGCGEVEAGS